MSADRTPPEQPLEQLTALAGAIAGLHELFTSLVSGGFTERQACMIIGEIVRGSQS